MVDSSAELLCEEEDSCARAKLGGKTKRRRTVPQKKKCFVTHSFTLLGGAGADKESSFIRLSLFIARNPELCPRQPDGRGISRRPVAEELPQWVGVYTKITRCVGFKRLASKKPKSQNQRQSSTDRSMQSMVAGWLFWVAVRPVGQRVAWLQPQAVVPLPGPFRLDPL